MEKVSCLMRTHHNWDSFTPNSIYSFLRQDYSHKELIIVDGSKTGLTVLENMNLIDRPEIKYYHLPPIIDMESYEEHLRNLARAREKCEDLATGKYLLSWDDDDINFPDRISESVKAVQGFDGAMINDLFILYENKYYLYPMNKGSFRPEFTAIYEKKMVP